MRLPILTLNNNLLLSADSALRRECRVIDVQDSEDLAAAQALISEMFEVLYTDASGVALAAPQIGILAQAVVVDYPDRETKKQYLQVFLNPKIVAHSTASHVDQEICLSVPGFSGKISRYESVTVQAYDHLGQEFEVEAQGFLARVLQHEIDHLNGILYVDKALEELVEVPDYPKRRLKPTLKKLGITGGRN